MIWPTSRQMVDGIRRGRAAELGLGPDATRDLVDLEPPCDWPAHSTGETGCDPTEHGAYVIRIRPHCTDARAAGVPAAILVICETQQIRQRGRAHETYRCECGETYAWGSTVDFLGPVHEYYPTRS